MRIKEKDIEKLKITEAELNADGTSIKALKGKGKAKDFKSPHDWIKLRDLCISEDIDYIEVKR